MKTKRIHLLLILLLLGCSDDDKKEEIHTDTVTGEWQGIRNYEDAGNASGFGSVRYELILTQTQSGNVAGQGFTSYSDKHSDNTASNQWTCNCHFEMDIVYDHPIIEFTITYDSGEDDEVFKGTVSDDRKQITGGIKNPNDPEYKDLIIKRTK
jgi:hypothetical protein